MDFLHLPTEIILYIASYLEFTSDIFALSRVNNQIRIILNDDYIYEHNVRHDKGRGLEQAIRLNSEYAVRKLLKHGAGKKLNFISLISDVAIQYSSLEIIQMLWQRTEDPSDPIPRCIEDRFPHEPLSDFFDDWDERYRLHYKDFNLMEQAVRNGRADVVWMLAGKGLNPAICWPQERLPLLMLASRLQVVKVLVKLGCNVNAQDTCGDTALKHALHPRKLEIARYLISKGAHLDVPGMNGVTPLAYACRSGYLEAVQLLVEAGACLDPPIIEGVSLVPLLWAAQKGHLGTVKYLMQRIDIKNRMKGSIADRVTLLTVACICGDLNLAERLLSSGHDVNQPTTNFHYSKVSPCSVLSWAAKSGHIAIVRLLLQHGAEVCAACDQGKLQPLARAAKGCHYEVMEILLAAGAPTNIPVHNGRTDIAAEDLQTILHVAAGEPSMCQLLLDHGAIPTQFLFLSAIQEGNVVLVQALLDRGFRPHGCPGDGWTFQMIFNKIVIECGGYEAPRNYEPFLKAIRSGNKEVIRYHLASGFDPNWSLPRTSAHTVVDYMIYEHSGDFATTLDIFIDGGLHQHTLTKALPLAVSRWHTAAVRALLERGADPLWQNADGETALEVADMRAVSMNSKKEILNNLLEVIYSQIGNLTKFRQYILPIEQKTRTAGHRSATKPISHFYWRRKYPVP